MLISKDTKVIFCSLVNHKEDYDGLINGNGSLKHVVHYFGNDDDSVKWKRVISEASIGNQSPMIPEEVYAPTVQYIITLYMSYTK